MIFCKRLSLLILGLIGLNSALAMERLIIKYKPTASQTQAMTAGKLTANQLSMQQMQPLSMSQVQQMSKIAGVSLKEVDQIGTGAHVLRIDSNLNQQQLQQVIDKLRAQSNLEYVEEDHIVKPMAVVPPLINPLQWDMESTSSLTGQSWVGDNFTGVWNVLAENNLIPGSGVVVAVVDTGYTPHPNFTDQNMLNHLEPLAGNPGDYGYQFISDCRMAGSCPADTPDSAAQLPPQANGLDLGTFISVSDTSNAFFAGCQVESSSWHGTHVTGTIVGQGYASEVGAESGGIVGGAYGAMVVPVRVLGKCGGFDSDVEAGILWAAGLATSNGSGGTVPINTNPAKVINLSLGSDTSCTADMQDAITQAINQGVIVVAAAGNGNPTGTPANVANFNPASCSGVISVAARGPLKELAFYSNYGATTITASGGDFPPNTGAEDEIWSTVWSSPESYQPESLGGSGTFIFYQGTSQATPHVSAAIADIISYLNSISQPYTYTGIIKVLQNSAITYNNCNSGGCATDKALDAKSAINYTIANPAVANQANPTPPPPTPPPLFGGGGGGCAVIQNGDDIGLLLVLLLIAGGYLYRRKKFNYKKAEQNDSDDGKLE